jgi:hypothetical protein
MEFPGNASNRIPAGVEIQLYTGGTEDGTIMRIPHCVHDLGKISFERIVEQTTDTVSGGVTTVKDVILYEWDCTYNPSGHARYRDADCNW